MSDYNMLEKLQKSHYKVEGEEKRNKFLTLGEEMAEVYYMIICFPLLLLFCSE